MSLDIVGIRRPSSYEEIFQTYANPQGGKKIESSPFTSMKDMCMAAAVIGYKHKIYKEDFSKDPNAIRISVFKQRDVQVIKMIAVGHDKDIKILDDHKKIGEIFEGYICGGMEILLEELNDNSKIQFDYIDLILKNS
jgi:dnd system-associated protein 4